MFIRHLAFIQSTAIILLFSYSFLTHLPCYPDTHMRQTPVCRHYDLIIHIKNIVTNCALSDGWDIAFLVVEHFCDLSTAQPRLVFAGHAIVMEEIPLAVVFHDAVVCSPSHDRLKDYALVGEGTIGAVTRGVTDEMGVARGIRKIIFPLILVHPAGLEEAVRVIGRQWVPLFVYDEDALRRFGKLQHIIGHTGHS